MSAVPQSQKKHTDVGRKTEERGRLVSFIRFSRRGPVHHVGRIYNEPLLFVTDIPLRLPRWLHFFNRTECKADIQRPERESLQRSFFTFLHLRSSTEFQNAGIFAQHNSVCGNNIVFVFRTSVDVHIYLLVSSLVSGVWTSQSRQWSRSLPLVTLFIPDRL